LSGAQYLFNFVGLQNCILLCGEASEFAATIGIVAVFKFVRQNPVVLGLVQPIGLLVLFAKITAQCLGVGGIAAHARDFAFIHSSHGGNIWSNFDVKYQVLVGLTSRSLLVSSLGRGHITIAHFGNIVISLHSVQIVRLTFFSNTVSSTLKELMEGLNGFFLRR
jgi:hypothetical protein